MGADWIREYTVDKKSLLSTFIFDDCPLIGIALNAVQYKYLTLLLKTQVAPLFAISGE